jgi:hypothetical protein
MLPIRVNIGHFVDGPSVPDVPFSCDHAVRQVEAMRTATPRPLFVRLGSRWIFQSADGAWPLPRARPPGRISPSPHQIRSAHTIALCFRVACGVIGYYLTL